MKDVRTIGQLNRRTSERIPNYYLTHFFSAMSGELKGHLDSEEKRTIIQGEPIFIVPGIQERNHDVIQQVLSPASYLIAFNACGPVLSTSVTSRVAHTFPCSRL